MELRTSPTTLAVSPGRSSPIRRGIGAVFVAEWQVEEQVLDGADALGREGFGQTRADSLHVLHRGLQFEHAGNRLAACGSAVGFRPSGLAGNAGRFRLRNRFLMQALSGRSRFLEHPLR